MAWRGKNEIPPNRPHSYGSARDYPKFAGGGAVAEAEREAAEDVKARAAGVTPETGGADPLTAEGGVPGAGPNEAAGQAVAHGGDASDAQEAPQAAADVEEQAAE